MFTMRSTARRSVAEAQALGGPVRRVLGLNQQEHDELATGRERDRLLAWQGVRDLCREALTERGLPSEVPDEWLERAIAVADAQLAGVDPADLVAEPRAARRVWVER
jgi:hypothetical protein